MNIDAKTISVIEEGRVSRLIIGILLGLLKTKKKNLNDFLKTKNFAKKTIFTYFLAIRK